MLRLSSSRRQERWHLSGRCTTVGWMCRYGRVASSPSHTHSRWLTSERPFPSCCLRSQGQLMEPTTLTPPGWIQKMAAQRLGRQGARWIAFLTTLLMVVQMVAAGATGGGDMMLQAWTPLQASNVQSRQFQVHGIASHGNPWDLSMHKLLGDGCMSPWHQSHG
jgi:hypothetical protein